MRGSAHHHAVAGHEPQTGGGLHIDGDVAILHKHGALIAAIVGDGGLELDRNMAAGLGVGEDVNVGQRGERADSAHTRRGAHIEESHRQYQPQHLHQFAITVPAFVALYL